MSTCEYIFINGPKKDTVCLKNTRSETRCGIHKDSAIKRRRDISKNIPHAERSVQLREVIHCDYFFKGGKNKGQPCNKNCKTGTKCGSHTIQAMEKKVKLGRIRRDDPLFQEKDTKYKMNYCEKIGITMEQLESLIASKKIFKFLESNYAFQTNNQ